jgi:DNA-binding transcriptional ArsR family regulator
VAANRSKAPKATQRGKAIKRSAKEAVDERLMKALNHSVRVQILSLMVDGEWSPNQLHKELGAGLSQISYHIKVLKDFELIELTKTEPRRGAVEHFYNATTRVFIPEDMAAAMPKAARMETLKRILMLAEKDMKKSLETGAFYDRPDFHATRTPMLLDEEGRAKLHAELDEVLERAIKTEEESLKRIAEEGVQSIPTRLVIFGFSAANQTDRQTSAFRQRS